MVEVLDEPHFQGGYLQSSHQYPYVENAKGIYIEEKHKTRVLAFNISYDIEQMRQLEDTLEEWEKDDSIELVILKCHQDDFCTWNDEKTCYELVKMVNMGMEGFYRTYWLNYHIASYKKSIIMLWNGIYMGTSLGLPTMCMFSIATEKAVFSMSEACIGFHTDAGASYFLSRLPNHLGEYLGLTGACLQGAELLACGFSTHFVPSKTLWKLESLLLALDSGEPNVIRSILDDISVVVEPPEGSILNRLDVIDRCFSKGTIEEIMEAIVLEKDNDCDWLQNVYASLQRSSPTGLKQTLKSIREGRNKSFFDCIKQEYRITLSTLRSKISSDLWEGIRAIKSNNVKIPKWKPPTLVEVTEDDLRKVFQPLGLEELQLPQEGELPRWGGKFQSMIHHRL